MQKISPCLWFDGNAEEAMNFYLSVFKRAKLIRTLHYGDSGPREKGTLLSATFELDGQEFIALNGGPAYVFSPAISFLVRCEDQQEVDQYWDLLQDGGSPQQCGWITDKFGVSWQIVPEILYDLLQDPDAARVSRVMQVMMKMVKLDIAQLRLA